MHLYSKFLNQYNLQAKSMNKNLFNTKPLNLDIQLSDHEDLPTTPKKKSQFKQQEFSSIPKIKYRYTIVQKPVGSWLGKVFLFIWLCVLIGSLVISYQSKLAQLEVSLKEEIQKCRKDFQMNKCEAPLKGIKLFCEEKLKCMQSNPEEEIRTRTQGTLFLGTIIRQFFQGLGLPLLIVGLLYAMWGGRKSSEVRKEFVEYYP